MNWANIRTILIEIALVITLSGLTYFLGYNHGYRKSLIENPTSVYNAPVSQVYKKGYRFVGINLGLISLGHIIEESK